MIYLLRSSHDVAPMACVDADAVTAAAAAGRQRRHYR